MALGICRCTGVSGAEAEGRHTVARCGEESTSANLLDVDAPTERLRTVSDDMLRTIMEAGFDTVRIPVRWAAHASPAPSFTIDPSFCALVDDAIDRALGFNLHVIVDAHHDRQMTADPSRAELRFFAGWMQIGASRLARRCRFASTAGPSSASTSACTT